MKGAVKGEVKGVAVKGEVEGERDKEEKHDETGCNRSRMRESNPFYR